MAVLDPGIFLLLVQTDDERPSFLGRAIIVV